MQARTEFILVAFGSMALLSGCKSLSATGPDPIFSEDQIELKIDATKKSLLDTLLETQDVAIRNKTTLKLISYTDIRYRNYRRELSLDVRKMKASISGLQLGADVAATLTGSIAVKNNYIALTSLLRGGEDIAENELLLKQTLDVLFAQMDASRAAKRVDIQRGLALPIGVYPGATALADIDAYYEAGTIDSAIADIQYSAILQTAASRESLRDITAITDAELSDRRNETDRIKSFINSLDATRLTQLRGYLQGKEITVEIASPSLTEKMALQNAMVELRSSGTITFEQLKAELERAGFPSP